VPVERVLITGAAGAIGSALRRGLRGRYRLLRLLDIAPAPDPAPGEEAVAADVRDLAAVEAATAGVDAVVHLAAVAEEPGFDAILETNIRGTYNVFEAARRRGARRVVFTSTNHTTGMYPRTERLDPAMPMRPDTLYGVSKGCGELLGRYYHDKFGLEVACLRIGTFEERPRSRRHLSTWISHRDTVQLVARCLSAPDLGYAVVYGASANDRGWWSSPDAARLGYRPEDNAERYADEVLRADPAGDPDDPTERCQGGPYAARDHHGGRPRR
jgi:uronate dehydrogenase